MIKVNIFFSKYMSKNVVDQAYRSPVSTSRVPHFVYWSRCNEGELSRTSKQLYRTVISRDKRRTCKSTIIKFGMKLPCTKAKLGLYVRI